MRKVEFAGALFIAASLLSGTVALACGDKLLVVGRGVRFQRTIVAHKGNVVIYSAQSEVKRSREMCQASPIRWNVRRPSLTIPS